MPAPPLRAFSDDLFELRQLAQQDDLARFLAEGFAAEWGEKARTDEFAHGAIAATDTVVRDAGDGSADLRVTAFCQRHDLGQVMAITLAMPESGWLFFVSLYRGLAAAAFRDDEAELFAECGRHLQQTWRHLPPDVVDALHAGPAEIRLGAHKVSVASSGELILLQRLQRGVQPALAPRLRAAMAVTSQPSARWLACRRRSRPRRPWSRG